MSIMDQIRSIFGRSKDADGDGVDDAMEESDAVAAVQRDIDRSGLDAVNRLNDTPGSSDRGTWG